MKVRSISWITTWIWIKIPIIRLHKRKQWVQLPDKPIFEDILSVSSRLTKLEKSNVVLDDGTHILYLSLLGQEKLSIAKKYIKEIKNPNINLPALPNNVEEHVWHLFVVQTKNRAEVQEKLTSEEIQTLIHYPVPPHKQKAYREFNDLSFPITEKIHEEVLSLPISSLVTEKEVKKIITTMNNG